MVHLAMLTLVLLAADCEAQTAQIPMSKWRPIQSTSRSTAEASDQKLQHTHAEEIADIELACKIARGRDDIHFNSTYEDTNWPKQSHRKSAAYKSYSHQKTYVHNEIVIAWRPDLSQENWPTFQVSGGIGLLPVERPFNCTGHLSITTESRLNFKEGAINLIRFRDNCFWLETWIKSPPTQGCCFGFSKPFFGTRRTRLVEVCANGYQVFKQPNFAERCFENSHGFDNCLVLTSDNRLFQSNSILEPEELECVDLF